MKYIIANWKMNNNLEDIKNWYTVFSGLVKNRKFENVEIIIAPSSIYIPFVKEKFTDFNFKLCSQDLSEFEKGAHTGHIGAFQMKEYCNYSIVGHSERKEPLEQVLLKRDISLRNGIKPIVCFVDPEDAEKVYTHDVYVAWEDPNNISKDGVYREKAPEDLEKGIKNISEKLPETTALIYGGSVNRNNIEHLKSIKEISGVLVGNASLDPAHFFDIVDRF